MPPLKNFAENQPPWRLKGGFLWILSLAVERKYLAEGKNVIRASSFIIFFVFFLLSSFSFADAQPYSPGQIFVKFRTSAAKPTPSLIDISKRHGITSVEPFTPARSTKPTAQNPLANLYRIHLTGDPLQAVADYASDPQVLYAQPNYLYTLHEAPNDPLYPLQFNLTQIGWRALRDALGPVQKQIVVAIIDSGIDTTHEDLQNSIWHNVFETNGQPGVDDDGNGYIDDIIGWDFTDAPDLPGKGDYLNPDNNPDDESSHGTHVSGIVSASTNNGKGIAGIASEAKLMTLRAGATLQSGDSFLEADDLAAAILYATDNGAHVINMSWGSPEQSYIIRDVLQYAASKNIVLIASAGNSGEPGLAYPAGYNETIAVGAVDARDRLASFSTTGAAIDLVAPGVNILSTQPGNIYPARSGTSFSAPQISAVAALLLSRYPALTPEQIRSMLVRTAHDLGTPGFDPQFGAGRLDGVALLSQLGQEQPAVQILTPDNDRAADSIFAISARVLGGNTTAYRFSYGIGYQPQTWIPLSNGTPLETIRYTWDVSTLPDTLAVLRLEADLSNGQIIEDRVQVTFHKPAPKISDLVYGPVMNKDRLVYEFHWKTDLRSQGGIAYRPFGVSTVDTLYSTNADVVHFISLPDDLLVGPLSFWILAKGHNGRLTTTPEQTLTYVPFRVPSNGFSKIATLPDGFLPDRVADFDNNGQFEIALMPYIEGEPFSAVQFYEFTPDGTFANRFQTSSVFLPWAIGDLTLDGKPDLLTASVLLITAFSGDETNPFPTQTILDRAAMWGGDIADTDGDKINEIVARSGAKRGIQIFRRDSDGIFKEGAFLSDPTHGSGELSSRFVIADLDGDGQTEILSGNADGGLWIYEYQNNTYQPIWQLTGDGDARWIGGGEDLDNDGKREFVVARAFEDDNGALNGFWSLEIYSSDGPNSYTREWATRITGVIPTGNGISTGDVDGDGRPDIAVCLRPDLYVYRSDAPNLYRPVWHTDIGLTHRPLIADLDADGAPEIMFNRDGAIHIVERSLPPFTVLSPQILTARPLGPSRVEIDWMQTPEATSYHIYRAVGDSSFTFLTALSDRTVFTDSLLAENQTYRYQITAILSDGGELRSGIASVMPNQPPLAKSIFPVGDFTLEILFNESMSSTMAEPSYFVLRTPPYGHPSSAVMDKQNQRIVLTFAQKLPRGSYIIDIVKGSDISGTPLKPVSIVTVIDYSGTLKERADADKSGRIDFPDFLHFATAFGTDNAQFDFNDDGVVNFTDFIAFASVFGQSVS